MPSLAAVVAATFIAQTFGAITFNSAAVYAPIVARELGVPAQAVGIHFAIGSITGVVSAFMFGGLIHRYGPLRTIQGLMLLGTFGLVIAASGTLAGILLAAAVVGLVGGIGVPAASLVLSRATPPERFGFVFSLKQAGAPIGIGIAGTAIPAMLLVMSWRSSVLVLAAAGLVVALVMQPLRAPLDRERNPRASLRTQSLLAPLAIIFRDRALCGIALGGLLLCMVQMSLVSYLVSYLHLDLGYSLLAAGAALTASQVSSMLSRLLWGVLMDRLGSPLRVLGLGAIVAGVFGILMALARPDWPYGVMVAIVMLYAFAALGWNGVYFAGIARLAPAGSVVAATAGAQFFLYSGTVIGPLIFAGIVSLSGSYATAFLAFAVMSLAAGPWMLREARSLRATQARQPGKPA